jgi:2-oxoglutarate ferredoxin oxidoreductase subunit alpha
MRAAPKVTGKSLENRMNTPEELHVLIGGEAGQGLVTIGQLLNQALVAAAYEIVVTQSYHSRIRGGHNMFSTRVATGPIQSPGGKIDLLVALNKETVGIHAKDMAPAALILVDDSWGLAGDNLLAIPYGDLGKEQMINVVAFGVLGSIFGLDYQDLEKLIRKTLGEKKPELLAENLAALEKSYHWAKDQRRIADKRLPPLSRNEARMIVNGNEAMALGAMAAGLKFGAFYPMSPATSIMLTIIAHADRMGIVVEQAEDEIAALNMALGASFAGAPAMVATSGGGFALMTEAVSLAGMTETPVVIVVAQRPGPATGLPTRTEQGDLEFVLHGGHGEFPRIILAPDSVESCFHLAHQAFLLAEEYQSPCFILTDQFLADSYRSVAPFTLADKKPVRVGGSSADVKGEYQRYALTDSGISPRLLPGESRHLVVADSDEHTPDGHITEDLEVRGQMVRKRLRKRKKILESFLPPVFSGAADAELLLVCWGSSGGAVVETAERLRREGRSAAALCFSQLWPLDPATFVPYLEKAGRVVCVEGNATGQFAMLLRRETGLAMTDLVLRYDGLPLTVDYIMEQLAADKAELSR